MFLKPERRIKKRNGEECPNIFKTYLKATLKTSGRSNLKLSEKLFELFFETQTLQLNPKSST